MDHKLRYILILKLSIDNEVFLRLQMLLLKSYFLNVFRLSHRTSHLDEAADLQIYWLIIKP